MAAKKVAKKPTLVREGTQWIIKVTGKKDVDAGRNERYARQLLKELYPDG
jgi:hypothetical protein